MANVVSYNDIIEIFEDIAKRHYQINTMFLGRDWELENNADLQYPVLQIYPTVANMPISVATKSYNTINVTIHCKVFDLTVPGEENEKDVHSDTLRTAQDIINEFSSHPYYVRSNISLNKDINFESFEEFEDDISAGWTFDLELRIINQNTFCGLPMDPIPGYSANGPVSTGQIVNVQYLTCDTLQNCPIIQDIEDDIVDLDIRVTALEAGSGGGNFIPLSGTIPGSDVTGPINFANNLTNVLSSINGDDGSYLIATGQNSQLLQYNSATNSQAGLIITGTQYSLASIETLSGITTLLYNDSNGALQFSSNNPFSGGIIGNQDFAISYTPLSFVQKAYVDNAIAAIPITSQTLAQTLVLGNLTGPNDIIVNAGQLLKSDTSGNYIAIDNGGVNKVQIFAEDDVNIISDNTNVNISGGFININAAGYGSLDGAQDYSGNYTANSFIQKVYADNTYVPVSVSSGGLTTDIANLGIRFNVRTLDTVSGNNTIFDLRSNRFTINQTNAQSGISTVFSSIGGQQTLLTTDNNNNTLTTSIFSGSQINLNASDNNQGTDSSIITDVSGVITFSSNDIVNATDIFIRGNGALVGALDYTSRYNNLSFVQKVYVDNSISTAVSNIALPMNQIPFGSATNIMTSSSNLIYDNTSRFVTVNGGYIATPSTINQFGLIVSTMGAMDAKIGLTTNSQPFYRGTIYVEDATQKLNLYALNSSIVFNNGIGFAVTPTMELFNNGKVNIYDLAGTGTRMVVADTNGQLSTQPIITISGSAPISYNSGTGVISISQATTSTNGYLSSTDWNTFNNKQPLDADLTAIAALSGTSGFLKTNGAGVWSVDTNTYVRTVYKDTINGTPLTGVTTNTLVKSVLIPANTFTAGDKIVIKTTNIKTGTAGTNTVRYYVNTTAAIGGVTLSLMAGVAANLSIPTERTLVIKNSTTNTQVFPVATNALIDNIASVALSTVAIDWTVNQYIVVASQNSNAGDTSTITYFEVIKF